MRRSVLLGVVGAASACGGGGDWLVDPHVIVDSKAVTSMDCRSEICVHNENTDLTVFDGATYLVHRTAKSQVLGPNSSLRISRSDGSPGTRASHAGPGMGIRHVRRHRYPAGDVRSVAALALTAGPTCVHVNQRA